MYPYIYIYIYCVYIYICVCVCRHIKYYASEFPSWHWAGPVCTRPGGPVFLADGFARTEVSLNAFGRGRQSAPMPMKGRRFDAAWQILEIFDVFLFVEKL